MYESSNSKIPIRWSAPEVLRQQPVTSKSDVFSFGVTMWEVKRKSCCLKVFFKKIQYETGVHIWSNAIHWNVK